MAQLNLPTLKQLRYFIALVEHQHFGHAARACFVSQSAFSAAIQELENVLEASLVDRTNRTVTITQIGREIVARARNSLREVEELVEVAQHSSGVLAGPLKLGVIPTIAPFLLPKVLPFLRRDFPDLKTYLHEGTTEEVHQGLLSGELDLILIALPYELRNAQILNLFKDPFLLAYHEKTALFDPSNYQPGKLPDESVLLLEDGHCLREHALEACRIRKTEKINRYAASSLLTLVEMVNADLGITFLPEMARDSALVANTRIKLSELGSRSYREIGLAWRRGSSREKEFRLLGKYFNKYR